MDKAGKEYWDDQWRDQSVNKVIDPHDHSLRNYVNRRFHELFVAVFDGLKTNELTLLEIGCSNSSWLPYFSQEFGFKVSGLDYSENGCSHARSILNNSGVAGDIVCADFFSTETGLEGRFDVVVSFGVVEHFADTAECLKAFSKFLKSGGIVITIIPNFVGINGVLQKIINHTIFSTHVIMQESDLRNGHISAGFNVVECNYFIPNCFGCINTGRDEMTLMLILKRIIVAILARLSMLFWAYDTFITRITPNKLFSSHIICTAYKP